MAAEKAKQGGFVRMGYEALQLQQMAQSCGTRRAHVLAVASGKGGVGKTHIAANMAICLAASGKKVLLLDGDMSLGNLDIILDLDHKYNISHLISGRKTVEEIINVGPHGLEVICGTSGLEHLANMTEFDRQRLTQQLSRLQETSDIIVIDTAAGISKQVVSFCLAADHMLVVTTPEAAAMTDAYAMIKVLVGNGFSERISLIVNMAESIAEGRKTYQQIANVARRFLNVNISNAGILLRDDKMTTAARMRKPVVLAFPRADITTSIANLAAKLNKSTVACGEQNGFFERVINWFF
jgi:flagellar biosynthesis protein FlhG